MRKCALGLMTIFLLASFIMAQDWTGQGRQVGFVYDEDGNPLAGVKVKLLLVKTQSGFETITDESGKWSAMGVDGGQWYIDFELAGYEPKKIVTTIVDIRGQVNKPIEITMKKVEGLFVTEDMQEEYKKGIDLFNEGKYEESIPVFETIVEKFPDAYIVYMSIGHCYFQMGNYDEAEKYYMKVLERDPEHVDTLIGLGNIYMNKGDIDKAMEFYEKIDFEKIQDATVLYNVGTIFYNNSKFDEALKYYQKAVEIKEDFLDAIYQLGLTYLTKGNNADALAQFENYLKFDPDSAKASQVQSFIDYLKKQK
jgi:tetratricopeptide (TPR) repeat protein